MSVSLSSRRRFLGQAAVAGLTGAAWPAWAADSPAAPPPAPDTLPPPTVAPAPEADAPLPPPELTSATLPLEGGPKERPITRDFPQKGAMVLQSTRPPALETPFEVFDKGVFTPTKQFYADWEAAAPATMIDPAIFRLNVHGNVAQPLSLSLSDITTGFHKVELIAVDQAAGNSRGLFQPRVPGVQWGNGAMGNAKWTGVRLSDILDQAGVRPGTVQVRSAGMDRPVGPSVPKLMTSLDLGHARDGEVIVAFAMNGETLPVLNGYPLRLVVPGRYGCYWTKALNDIELLTAFDDNYWTATAFRVPDTPHADIPPGTTGYGTAPIGRMGPRAFITNIMQGEKMAPDTATLARGIAMGGDNGVARVDFSSDGGQSWKPAKLGKDYGKYSFRQWQMLFKPPAGALTLMVRCTSTSGATQPEISNWNPSGFMRNGVEAVEITAIGSDDASQ